MPVLNYCYNVVECQQKEAKIRVFGKHVHCTKNRLLISNIALLLSKYFLCLSLASNLRYLKQMYYVLNKNVRLHLT